MIAVEYLESRQLFCGTAATSGSVTPTTPTTAIHADAAKALRPSQVVGTYTGNAHVKVVLISVSVGVTLELHPSGSAYAGKLSVSGYGSYSFTVTNAQLLKLREGKMTVPFNRNGEKGSITVVIGKNAATASGSFSVSGTISASGTFNLTKEA